MGQRQTDKALATKNDKKDNPLQNTLDLTQSVCDHFVPDRF